jgi:hypothetical protein
MNKYAIAAITAATVAIAALGGLSTAAAEDGSVPDDVAEPTPTATVDQEDQGGNTEDEVADDGDALDEEDREPGGGLVCILVPIESEAIGAGTDESAVPPAETDETPSLEQILAESTIECSGTGNERSSEVALVPRFLAHSDEWSGAEKAAIIRAWAKTRANKKSGDDLGSVVGVDAEGEDGALIPGHSGGPGGNGNGNGGQHRGQGRH